jgi:hypothetical protein
MSKRPTFCAGCNVRLTVTRKALPEYGRIIDVVEPHICSDKPVELDLEPDPAPAYVEQEKIVQKLDGLPKFDSLRDRRSPDHVKDSTAPVGLLNQIKAMRDVDE